MKTVIAKNQLKQAELFALKFVCLALFFSTLSSNSAAYSEIKTADYSAGTLNKIQAQLNLTKDTHAALEQLQELLKKEPGNAEAHMMCGKVLQLMGFEELAEQEYKTADKLDPTRPDSILSLFHNRLEKYGYKAAYEYLQYVQRRFPYDPSVLIMQGLLARIHGSPIEAEYFYTLAMERYPNTPGLATALSSLRIVQKRYKEAVELANRDLALKKDHPAANMAKGQALLQMGEAGQAIPFLQIAYQGTMDKKGSADLLSRALISNGQYGDAIEPSLVCMYWTPTSEQEAIAQLKRRLLLILSKTGPSEILNTLEVVKRETNDREKVATLYFASGDVLDTGNCPQAAEKSFEEGLKLRPFSGRPYMRLGVLKERQRDYQGALKDYELAHQFAPEDRESAARLLRLIKRAPAQEKDLAWSIKDLLRGGRRSQLYRQP